MEKRIIPCKIYEAFMKSWREKERVRRCSDYGKFFLNMLSLSLYIVSKWLKNVITVRRVLDLWGLIGTLIGAVLTLLTFHFVFLTGSQKSSHILM